MTFSDVSKGIENKKGEEDGKYIPINVRMQRTQVTPENRLLFIFKRRYNLSLHLDIMFHSGTIKLFIKTKFNEIEH